MFEEASRLKLRFPYRGQISTEDLWDLSANELDGIFKGLNFQFKSQQEESLLDSRSDVDREAKLQIDIIRHVVKVKLNEDEAKRTAADRKAKKQRLMEIIAEKQDTEVRGKSLEDLQKMVDELG